MIDEVVAVLQADSQLTALLSGGIYNYLDRKEISRQFTPEVYDANGELQPCLLVREETRIPENSLWDSATLYLTLFFYQRYGYREISAARGRVYKLLHRTQPVVASGDSIYEIFHAGDIAGQEDVQLNASLEQSRYQVVIQRGKA